jgi:hypothetical protein
MEKKDANDQIFANQVAGMPLDEAIFQAGYSAGVDFEKGRQTGAVLRETIEDILLKTGKHNQDECSEIADMILRDLPIAPTGAVEQDFIDFIKAERNAISKEMLNDEWWLSIPPAKRVVVENILIAYDQMVSIITKAAPTGAAVELDSIRMVGRAKERFKELEEKEWEWRSFYGGWLEGRADMLQEIKGIGIYKK